MPGAGSARPAPVRNGCRTLPNLRPMPGSHWWPLRCRKRARSWSKGKAGCYPLVHLGGGRRSNRHCGGWSGATARRPRFIPRLNRSPCAVRSTAMLSGQAQKEVTINEAFGLADMLLHAAIDGERSAPPTTPTAGAIWLIGPAAQGEWAGRTGQIAGWSEGGWRFIPPRTGMRLYDRQSGAMWFFGTQWQTVQRPLAPQDGSVVDAEARRTLAAILEALGKLGFFS